jgi:hypothetical protein
MAKPKSRRKAARVAPGRKRAAVRASGKRPKARVRAKRARSAASAKRARRSSAAKGRKRTARRTSPSGSATFRGKVPQLDRARRTLDESVPTPPSSLNMERHGSAARSGRAEMEDNLRKHGQTLPGITAGDVDANYENAYFSGDEAPGGDNPTPDQDVVDDIGRALGLEYNDNEELKSGDKVSERDKHRWELDPASSEDYRDRE